jgi:hypothetical protein
MIYIEVPTAYAHHIAFLTKCMNLRNVNIVRPPDNFILTSEIIEYYKTYDQITDLTGFLENNAVFAPINSNITHSIQGNDISHVEITFLQYLHSLKIIPATTSFGIDKSITREFINWSIESLFHRKAQSGELLHHTNKAIYYKQTILGWLIELFFCQEANPLFRPIKNKNPRLAILLCGYVRNYKNVIAHQRKLLDYPFVDVFIHTWDDHGFKNHGSLINKEWIKPNNPKIDLDNIHDTYHPVKVKVENNQQVLPTLSLRGKVSPIFVFHGQAKDDCSRYINSQLYSIYEAYKLMEEYENENNFKYDGIIKLRFDFLLGHVDIVNILNDIEKDAVWFPHARYNHHGHHGGGGGCISCDRSIPHDDHTNDVCDVWFYGKRNSAQKACETFLHGERIMKENHTTNLQKYKSTRHIEDTNQDIVYIVNFQDIEKNIVCFYPERLLRENLKGIKCLSSMNLRGGISQ